MNKGFMRLFVIFIIMLCLLMVAVGSAVRAQQQTEPERKAQWWQLQNQTNWMGGVMTQYAAGPDYGFGPTISGYEYRDPTSGTYMSYKVQGMGMGALMPSPFIYGGPESQFGAAYGPLAQSAATGQAPMFQSTFGWDTQLYSAGNILGSQQYTFAQPNMLGMMMLGSFGPGNMMGGGFLGPSSYLGGGFGAGIGYPFAMGASGMPGTGILGGQRQWFTGLPSMWNPNIWGQQQQLPNKIY